jgi:hypothetical protein
MVAHSLPRQKFSLARNIAFALVTAWAGSVQFLAQENRKVQREEGVIFFAVGQMSGSHKGRKGEKWLSR